MDKNRLVGFETEIEKSIKMLANGATKGMVANHLDRQGVPKHQQSHIVDQAQNVIDRRDRTKGALITLGGAVVIAVGLGVYYLFFNAGLRRGVTIPGAILMAGLILVIYGIRETFRSRSRSRLPESDW